MFKYGREGAVEQKQAASRTAGKVLLVAESVLLVSSDS